MPPNPPPVRRVVTETLCLGRSRILDTTVCVSEGACVERWRDRDPPSLGTARHVCGSK